MATYYIDSCIWLNLFQKEGDPTKGVPFWAIADDFVKKIICAKESRVAHSSFVLKEVKYTLNDEALFYDYLFIVKKKLNSSYAYAISDDYDFARKLESESRFSISFFDCMHIALCKRLGFILVTRDKKLITFARRYIIVGLPEELFDQII